MTDFSKPLGLCSCCESPKPLLVNYRKSPQRYADLFKQDSSRGLWRFAPLLPVSGVDDDYALDVGSTPIIPHRFLSEQLGLDIFLKLEQSNPSGSFKDRGLAMAVAFGVACGSRRFCLPTQGNAGVAAALFSARMGIEAALVYMPDGYQNSYYHKAALYFGAEVRFSGKNIAQSGKAMRRDYAEQIASGEFVDLSTFFEPGRLEGKKTLGLEIIDYFGREQLVDYIIYPTGGGTGLVGIWKAFQEMKALGFLSPALKLPKLVAVQSVNCAPVVSAFERGLAHVEPLTSKGTIADGLDVPGAIMGHAILSALNESFGLAVAVTESQIHSDFEALGRCGINAGNESAATLSALRQLKRDRIIAPDARVLLLFTSGSSAALSAMQ